MMFEQMENTLKRLGIEPTNFRGVEIQALCPAHEERTGKKDRNPSWYINADTGAHICFSCGFRGSVVSLAAYLNKMEYEEAKTWLDLKEDLDVMWERAKFKPTEEEQEYVEITEAALKGFIAPPDNALRARGLTKESASKYEIHWGMNHDVWIIPVRDPISGCLVGWQEKGFTSRYFKNYPPGMKKSNALFGYKQLQGNEVIVVESPLDVVRLSSIGIEGGVALFGASISELQLNLIRGSRRIIMALDNDDAGHKENMRLLKLARQKQFELWFFNYDNIDVKDVGAMSKDEVLQGLQSSTYYLQMARRMYV